MSTQTQIEARTLTGSELEHCRNYLKQTGEGVLVATVGLSQAQWDFKPSPDRWSVAEIVEHMVVIQELVLGPIREQLAQAPVSENRDYAQVDAIVVSRFPVPSVRLEAPELARPSGRFAPDEALERLIVNCGRLREYVESSPDLRLRVIEARPLKVITNGEFEHMDGYQWVLAVAAHTDRHTRQIREVQADSHYPA
jgi:hypothetical protein